MKKTVLALGLTLLFAAPAFAETSVATEAQPADQAAVTQAQEQAQAPQVQTYGKVGRIIGRVIRDIARGDRRDGRDGRWDRRHRRGPQRIACYAQDRRGQYYQAVGYDTYRTQRQATNECYMYSRFCADMGCRYY